MFRAFRPYDAASELDFANVCQLDAAAFAPDIMRVDIFLL
jgi:hypothetical protein